MMKKLLDKVTLLVFEELKMANGQYPLFASSHEASAVILEEVEEADDEIARMCRHFYTMWQDIKSDEDYDCICADADDLKKHAIRCACECIQVAAMCEKIKIKKE